MWSFPHKPVNLDWLKDKKQLKNKQVRMCLLVLQLPQSSYVSVTSVNSFLREPVCVSILGRKEEADDTLEVTLPQSQQSRKNGDGWGVSPLRSPDTHSRCFRLFLSPPRLSSFGVSSWRSWDLWRRMASLCGSSQAGCWHRAGLDCWLFWYKPGSAWVEEHSCEQGPQEAAWRRGCQLYISSWPWAQAGNHKTYSKDIC